MAAKRPVAIRDLSGFNESVNILVYGDSGTGKTVLGGTAPNALFLSTEQGTISAKRQGSKAKVWRIMKWEDLEEAFKWLRDNPDHGFEWVVLDSVTKMQEQLKRDVLEKRVQKRGDSDEDIPEIADHQKFQNKFKRFITAFVELPVNVLFTATTMRREDEEGEDLVLPNIDGKGYAIANYACAEMDVVGYYGVSKGNKKNNGETIRRFVAQSTPPYFAKDRYDVLGKWLDNPTMPMIIGLIEGDSSSGDKMVTKTKDASTNEKAKAKSASVKTEDEEFDADDDQELDFDDED